MASILLLARLNPQIVLGSHCISPMWCSHPGCYIVSCFEASTQFCSAGCSATRVGGNKNKQLTEQVSPCVGLLFKSDTSHLHISISWNAFFKCIYLSGRFISHFSRNLFQTMLYLLCWAVGLFGALQCARNADLSELQNRSVYFTWECYPVGLNLILRHRILPSLRYCLSFLWHPTSFSSNVLWTSRN